MNFNVMLDNKNTAANYTIAAQRYDELMVMLRAGIISDLRLRSY